MLLKSNYHQQLWIVDLRMIILESLKQLLFLVIEKGSQYIEEIKIIQIHQLIKLLQISLEHIKQLDLILCFAYLYQTIKLLIYLDIYKQIFIKSYGKFQQVNPLTFGYRYHNSIIIILFEKQVINKKQKILMRRTPYTDRVSRIDKFQQKEAQKFIGMSTSNKEEITRLGNNISAYLPAKTTTKPYHIQSKYNRSVLQRPYTVNRAQSQFKHRQDQNYKNSNGHSRSNSQNRHDKQLIDPNSLNKDIWLNNIKEIDVSNLYVNRNRNKEDHSSKGRIYRGSSWKADDRIRATSKDMQVREASRYSHTSRGLHNLTPTTKEERSSIKKSTRQSGLFDILGKNAKQKKENAYRHQDDNFFEYVMRFSYRTKKGSIPSNPDKVNQDTYILVPNINSKTWQHFFGVCDGHGPLGHLVSGYIKNNLPSSITQSKYLQKKPAETLMKAFETTYQKMLKQSRIDMTFSGSTIISCYMLQNKLYCCNVGDSRAIFGRCSADNKWSAVALSEDHKPTIPRQAERIRKMNGRVQSYKDEYGEPIGPLRVWLKNQNVPGLAMTRSFGDLMGASVGVSPVPQIKQFTITKQDRILLIASDGVFQFLSNQQLINSISPFYNKNEIQQASDYLLNMAHRSWTKTSSIIDDITFILIFITYEQCDA